MPAEISADFPILGYSRREEPRDVLVLPQGCRQLDVNKPIGTSSPRRRVQLMQIYEGCQIRSVRGNVLTRLHKLDSGAYGALVLAAAGLRRIGLNDRISKWFTVDQVVPAAGQGILAVQGRRDFDCGILEGFFDEDAKWQALAERSFVNAFGGGCSSPVAAYAFVKGNEMILTGMTADLDDTVHKDKIVVPKQYAQQAGIRLAQKLAGLS